MIGADPELFLHNGKKFISAIGRIGGTKEEPRRLLGGFCLQEDNVAVEYNIPPADTVENFVSYNEMMLEEIAYYAKKQDLVPKIVSSANFDNEELSNPKAQVFGCDPDFDAWELEPNPSPQSDDKSLRSAGGHIHVGIEDSTMGKIRLVRVLDLLIGVPLAIRDPESKRRELYGRAGACRIKPYGVEYRTPSNVWLRDKKLMQSVADVVLTVTKNKPMFMHYSALTDTYSEIIKKAINNLDQDCIEELTSFTSEFWDTKKVKHVKKPLDIFAALKAVEQA